LVYLGEGVSSNASPDDLPAPTIGCMSRGVVNVSARIIQFGGFRSHPKIMKFRGSLADFAQPPSWEPIANAPEKCSARVKGVAISRLRPIHNGEIIIMHLLGQAHEAWPTTPKSTLACGSHANRSSRILNSNQRPPDRFFMTVKLEFHIPIPTVADGRSFLRDQVKLG
jgi:hypothetical protein